MSGPELQTYTCRQCRYWGWVKARKFTDENMLEPKVCRYRRDKTGDERLVKHDTPACSKFTRRNQGPSLHRVASQQPRTTAGYIVHVKR